MTNAEDGDEVLLLRPFTGSISGCYGLAGSENLNGNGNRKSTQGMTSSTSLGGLRSGAERQRRCELESML